MSASDFAKALNPLALMQQAQTMEMNRMRMDQMKQEDARLKREQEIFAANVDQIQQSKGEGFKTSTQGLNWQTNPRDAALAIGRLDSFRTQVPEAMNAIRAYGKQTGRDMEGQIKYITSTFDTLGFDAGMKELNNTMSMIYTPRGQLETKLQEQEAGRIEIGEKLSRVIASGSVVELDSLRRDIESGEYNLTPAQLSQFNNMWGSLSVATEDIAKVNMLAGTSEQQKQILQQAEYKMRSNPNEGTIKNYQNLKKIYNNIRNERGAALEANSFASEFLKENPDAQKFEGANVEMLMRKYPGLKFEQANAVLTQLAFRKEDEVRKATTKAANRNYAKAYKGEPSRVLANAISITQSDKEKKALGMFRGMELNKTNHPVTKEPAVAYVPSDRSKVYYVTKNPNGTKRISAFALSEEGAYTPMGEGVDISSKDFFEDHFNTLSFLEDPNKMTADTLASIKDFIQENVVKTITIRPDRRGPLVKSFIDPKTKEKISSGPIRDIGVALNNILMSSHPLISTKRSKKERDDVLAKDVAKQIMDLYLDAVIAKNLGM